MTVPVEPPTSQASAPFWDATREQRLVLPWCRACERVIFYPREICPTCLGSEIDWREASGRGSVYAASVQHRPPGPAWSAKVPYVVALVELDEGARLMSNVVGCPPDQVAVGMPVQVSWEPMSDGRHLPQFEPATAP